MSLSSSEIRFSIWPSVRRTIRISPQPPAFPPRRASPTYVSFSQFSLSVFFPAFPSSISPFLLPSRHYKGATFSPCECRARQNNLPIGVLMQLKTILTIKHRRYYGYRMLLLLSNLQLELAALYCQVLLGYDPTYLHCWYADAKLCWRNACANDFRNTAIFMQHQ